MAIGLPIHPIIANFSAVLRRNTEIKEAYKAATARQQAKQKENERKRKEMAKKNILKQNANSVCSCSGEGDASRDGLNGFTGFDGKLNSGNSLTSGFAPRNLRSLKGRRNTLAFL